jgi:type I restriction enzyme, S subunit
MIKLGDVVTLVNDNDYDPINNGVKKYVAGGHMESEKLHIQKFGDVVTDSEVIGSAFHKLFKKNHILYGTRFPNLKKASIATFDGLCANTTLVLKTKSNSDLIDGLLPFILQWDKFTEYSIKKTVGSTNPYVKWSDLKNFEFFLPSKNEQLKLHDLFWAIQNSIDNLEDLIQKTNLYFISKREQLFSKGIDHTQFRSIKSLYGTIVKIPKSWDLKTFDELFTFLKTGTNPRSDLETSGNFQYIHYGDVHQKWTTYVLDCDVEQLPYIPENKVKQISLLKDDDLVIVDASEDHEGSGTSILLKNIKKKKIVAGLHTYALRSKKNNLTSNYKIFLTSIPFVKKQIISFITGISVYGLSKTNLKNILIPLPSLSEQEKISTILLSIQEQLLEQNSHLKNLYALRKSTLNLKLTTENSDVSN